MYNRIVVNAQLLKIRSVDIAIGITIGLVCNALHAYSKLLLTHYGFTLYIIWHYIVLTQSYTTEAGCQHHNDVRYSNLCSKTSALHCKGHQNASTTSERLKVCILPAVTETSESVRNITHVSQECTVHEHTQQSSKRTLCSADGFSVIILIISLSRFPIGSKNVSGVWIRPHLVQWTTGCSVHSCFSITLYF